MSRTIISTTSPTQWPPARTRGAEHCSRCRELLTTIARFLPRVTSSSQAQRSLADGYEAMAREHESAGNEEQAECLHRCAEAIRAAAGCTRTQDNGLDAHA